MVVHHSPRVGAFVSVPKSVSRPGTMARACDGRVKYPLGVRLAIFVGSSILLWTAIILAILHFV